MDFSTWRPHGLILEWGMESLYLAAQVAVDNHGNIIDPKEHLTAKLFEFLFHRHVFTGEFMCFSQQPPYTASRKACDLVVQYPTGEGTWQVACFAVAQRANNQTDTLVLALEYQALGYCHDFLDATRGIDMIYACTMVGASIRCWKYMRGSPDLIGFWGGDELGDFASYLDIGLDENRDRIMSAFNHMKSTPSSNLVVGMSHSQI